jgi:DNA-binding MarR family transcriptional regulator
MSDQVDIVDRLRISWTSMTEMANAERLQAADEIERLRTERDEARREIVLLLNGCCSWSKLTQEIKKRGWECLKEASA